MPRGERKVVGGECLRRPKGTRPLWSPRTEEVGLFRCTGDAPPVKPLVFSIKNPVSLPFCGFTHPGKIPKPGDGFARSRARQPRAQRRIGCRSDSPQTPSPTPTPHSRRGKCLRRPKGTRPLWNPRTGRMKFFNMAAATNPEPTPTHRYPKEDMPPGFASPPQA